MTHAKRKHRNTFLLRKPVSNKEQMVTLSTAVPIITTERELSYYDEHTKTGSCLWFVPQKQNQLCVTLLALVQETVYFRCKSH
jgi:hypothetical protein